MFRIYPSHGTVPWRIKEITKSEQMGVPDSIAPMAIFIALIKSTLLVLIYSKKKAKFEAHVFHGRDLEHSKRNLHSKSSSNRFPSEFDQISGKSWLRSLLSLGASSLYPKGKKKRPQKGKKKKKSPSRWFMRKKNTETGLSLSNFLAAQLDLLCERS